MDVSNQYLLFPDWKRCPSEILSLIFRHLSASDLISCLFVNCTWRRILENDGRINWQEIAQLGLSDSGVDIEKMSNLDWHGIVFTSGRWRFGIEHIKADLLHKYKGKDSYSPAMAVYKDKLYVYAKKYAECINIETRQSTTLKECSKDMYVVDESDYIRLLFDECSKLYLVGKKCVNDHSSNRCEIDSQTPILYALDRDRCYVFEDNNMRVLTWANQKWESKFVARYYGATDFAAMVASNGDVFLIGSRGDLWKTSMSSRIFTKRGSFLINSLCAQANYNAMLKVIVHHTRNEYSCDYREIFVEDVVCATYHAETLLLAYRTGRVEACVLPPVTNSLLKGNYVKVSKNHSFNQQDTNENCLTEHTNSYSRYDLCKVNDYIYSMAVYEGGTCGHLLLNCGHTIYQYTLTFPGFV